MPPLNPAPPGSLLKGNPMKKAPKVAKEDAEKVGADHLAFLRTLPCVITGARPVEAAHVSMTSKIWGKSDKGVGKKSADRWALPLSPAMHREQHELGERAFWKKHGIDPLVVACRLWEASGDAITAQRVIADARSVMKGGA
jgi:hypothetical protein